MITLQGFVHRIRSLNYLQNRYYLMKVLLKRFHLNGNTLRFRAQTRKLELRESTAEEVAFVGFHPQAQKLEPPYKSSSFHLGVTG